VSGDEAAESRMRASRADRERVIEVLKTAFVHERLTKDELDARVGQALAARTYADLELLTAGIPAERNPAKLPMPPFQPYPPVRAAVKGSVIAIAATALATSIFAGVIGHDPGAAAIVVIALTVCTVIAGLLTAMIVGVVTVISRCL
jgi:hypothetical protein